MTDVTAPGVLPDISELEKEYRRTGKRSVVVRVLRRMLSTLIVAAAAAVLVEVMLLPVFRIYGTSMTPTLNQGEIVVARKSGKTEQGDIVGVYWGSKLLIKRCIAAEHQWVDLTEDGDVTVDGVTLREPYITEKAFGDCNIELPYQVPDGAIFVMGDHRKTSIDSRNSSLGCIRTEDIAGKIVFRIWPLSAFGSVE